MLANPTTSGPVRVGEVLNTMHNFRRNMNGLLLQRRFFIDKVLPILKLDQDYYIINNKKVLSKGGAEKLCQLYGLTASFERDFESLKSFPDAKGLVIYKCVLTRGDGSVAGEGRGAAVLDRNNNDINKCIKMSEKSSFVSATLRATFLSSDFTQDLESMPEFRDHFKESDGNEEVEIVKPENEVLMATDRQKSYLNQLIRDNINDEGAQERALEELETATRHEASEMIASFVGVK